MLLLGVSFGRFHLNCVSLTSELAAAIDDYECATCAEKAKAKLALATEALALAAEVKAKRSEEAKAKRSEAKAKAKKELALAVEAQACAVSSDESTAGVDHGAPLYCICRQPEIDDGREMVMCDGCDEWCVGRCAARMCWSCDRQAVH